MNADEIRELFQSGYFDPIDKADPVRAAEALHPNVIWSHLPAWRKDALGQSTEVPDVFRSRAEVEAALVKVIPHTTAADLKHTVVDLVADGDRGAFLAKVSSSKRPDEAYFMVWFEVSDGLIKRYTMRPTLTEGGE